MHQFYNDSGKPLSSYNWLLTHHLAKLSERTLFAHKIVKNNPKKIVDLGCGPGLWLDVLNKIAPPSCEFVGIDSDVDSLSMAKALSVDWVRKVSFVHLDIERSVEEIPDSEVYLMFNMFSYITDPTAFLKQLKSKLINNGSVVIRQYDGAAMRFGPLSQKIRFNIDNSLFASVNNSKQFHHYEVDDIFQAIQSSAFREKDIRFELFERTTPYSEEFLAYLKYSIEWILSFISENSFKELESWYDNFIISSERASYFTEVDLIAVLS